jgi:hypothetical protein
MTTRQVEFDKNANAFSERYGAFLGNIKAAYQARILSKSLNYKSIKSFEQEASNLARLYLEGEIEQCQRAEVAIKQYIESDFAKTGMDAEVLDNPEYMNYLSDFTSYVYSSIRHQVSKDILFATQRLRVESIKLLNSNFNYMQTIIDYKEPEFVFNDKAGRNLPSKKYIRTMVRDYFVKSYNDIFVENLILHNIDAVQVYHIDQTHKHYGLILSVNNNDNELNYFKVRDDIFHPNSNAVLMMVGD